MTARQLANKLRPYAIHPKTIRIAGTTSKGFYLSDFSDVFERYLSYPVGGVPNVTASQVNDRAESGDFLPVTDSSSVTDRKSLFSAIDGGCYGVTDKTGGIPEKEENGIVEIEI